MKLLRFIFLLLAVWLATKLYWLASFPYTHDGQNHLARFANYKVALKEGQLPPRLAPNLLNHYGYPVFNYNYPLANLVSVPFSVVKLNYELTFKIILVASVVMGMFGLEKWLKALGFSQKWVYLGWLSLAVHPYLITASYYRGNIGEIMSLMLLPWLAWLIEQHKQTKATSLWRSALGIGMLTGLFLLAHNITAIFGLGLLWLYALISSPDKTRTLKWLGLTTLWGVGLSLWFWLPALAEKSQIVLDNARFFTETAGHLPTVHQLLFSPVSFGFSYLGPVDSLSFSLGLLNILGIVILTIWLLVNRASLKKQNLNLSLVILSWLLVIAQLPFTAWLWQTLPIVSYIQFPWRLSLFFAMFSIPLTLWAFQKVSILRGLLVFTLLLQVVNTIRLKPVDTFHLTNADYEAFAETTSTQHENMPKTFTYTGFADWQPSPTILEGEGEITVERWSGSSRSYTINITSESAIVVEPTARYLGWQTTVDDQLVNYLDNPIIAGRLAYYVRSGTHQVTSRFTQDTPARTIGNLVSLGSLLAWLVSWGSLYVNKNTFKRL